MANNKSQLYKIVLGTKASQRLYDESKPDSANWVNSKELLLSKLSALFDKFRLDFGSLPAPGDRIMFSTSEYYVILKRTIFLAEGELEIIIDEDDLS